MQVITTSLHHHRSLGDAEPEGQAALTGPGVAWSVDGPSAWTAMDEQAGRPGDMPGHAENLREMPLGTRVTGEAPGRPGGVDRARCRSVRRSYPDSVCHDSGSSPRLGVSVRRWRFDPSTAIENMSASGLRLN